MKATLTALGLACVLAFSACANPNPPSVSVTPETQTLPAGSAAVTITAAPVNSSDTVAWTLSGPGTISATTGSSITYTPPTSVTAQTNAVVTATLPTSGATDTSVITITP
jgi:hypothetical protein